MFPAFIADTATRLVCVEPDPVDQKRAEEALKRPGTALNSGERKVARNILDRLEYPSVAREHALFRASGRVEYPRVMRRAARAALLELARCEGLVPAIETAHVLAWTLAAAKTLDPAQAVMLVMTEGAEKDAWDISQMVDEKA